MKNTDPTIRTGKHGGKQKQWRLDARGLNAKPATAGQAKAIKNARLKTPTRTSVGRRLLNFLFGK
jgi:hypothetical protein